METESPAKKERQYLWRAGILVAIALIAAATFIIMIGRERRLFQPVVTYSSSFENVEGLQANAPVWLGGLEVGRVRRITLSPRPDKKYLRVEMELLAQYQTWVRQDSVARVTGRGLLGDKAIDLTVGSPSFAALPPGSEVQSGQLMDLNALMRASGEVLQNSVAITEQVREAVEAYAAPQTREDVQQAVRSLRRLLEDIEKGEGALHALVYDETLGAKTRQFMTSANRAAIRMERALGEAEHILTAVREGKGTAHALIYEREALKSFEQLGQAAEEIGLLVSEGRKNQGSALHELTYGDSGQLLSDLGAAAKNLRLVTDKIREGEGSLGAIINDPTVYEELKQVLGNLRRNRVLRAMVRYLMTHGENLEEAGAPPDAQETGVGGGGKDSPPK